MDTGSERAKLSAIKRVKEEGKREKKSATKKKKEAEMSECKSGAI